MLNTLSTTMPTHNKTADYLFSCYFSANHNQTLDPENPIYSFANDLQRSANSVDTLLRLMKESLTNIYSQTFDPEGINIELKSFDYPEDKIYFGVQVAMKLRTRETQTVFDFSTSLEKIDRTIDNVNLIKKSVTIGPRL